MKKSINHTKEPFPIKGWIPIIILLIFSLACIVPIENLWGEQTSQENPPADEPVHSEEKLPQDSPSPPPPTMTAPPDTATPIPTDTLTPTAMPTATPYVIISGNTHCRYGPGSIYQLLHTYLSGEQALLLGKNADEDFWYTKDGSGSNPDCWLWGKYATPVGDTSMLPIFTPPPTPTPYLDFAPSYWSSDCGAGSCWLWIKINNTGTMDLESVKVYAKNKVTGDDSTYQGNLFTTGVMGADIASVPVAGSGYTHSDRLPNPSGNKVEINITACSKNGLSGICLTRYLVVTP